MAKRKAVKKSKAAGSKGKAKSKGKASKKATKKTSKKAAKKATKPAPKPAPKAAKPSKKAAKKSTKPVTKKATKSASKPASKKVSPIPRGYQSLTPHIVLDEANKAIEFYKTAFGAKLQVMMPGPNNKVAHAEIDVFGSKLMLSDMFMESTAQPPTKLGGTTGGLMLYVKDTDAVYGRALAAGCKELMAPTNAFWGDRFAKLLDPYGHIWSIATRIEDLTPEEMQKRMAAEPPPG